MEMHEHTSISGAVLKINGNRVVTFSTPRGCSTPTLKGYKMLFYRDKEVEGVTFMSLLVYFPFIL